MSNTKIFKDPIYGYIEIENDLIRNVIDKPAFQRLRRIIQTSYTPLYASALHNRFTHSLGVYHLGKLAINAIKSKRGDYFSSLINIDKIFLYACLLHDVGHAPFSHTGEKFFLGPLGSYTKMHEHLKQAVQSINFSKDIPIKAANPHEIMSAIIGITEFPNLFSSSEEKEFFARAITGYHYNSHNINNDIKNCLIDLLNSKFIDVDKLDYLMRDTYMTGFESVNIDYKRLLSSLDILKDSNSNIHLVYEKNAISVIENVVYARDLEKKWIQIHPAVLYDIYILEKSIESLKEKLDVKDKEGKLQCSLFSYEALLETGVSLNEGVSIKLFCDDDLIFLLKNKYEFSFFKEYLNRNLRKHPLWKSESEYKTFFISPLNDTEQERFNAAMGKLANFLSKNGLESIDDKIITLLQDEIKNAEELLKKQTDDNSNEQSIKALIKDKKEMLNILEPCQVNSLNWVKKIKKKENTKVFYPFLPNH